MQRPDVAVFGIGDSGTRGVHNLLQNLGLAMSLTVSDGGEEDDYATAFGAWCGDPLLKESDGVISRAGFNKSRALWNTAGE